MDRKERKAELKKLGQGEAKAEVTYCEAKGCAHWKGLPGAGTCGRSSISVGAEGNCEFYYRR